MTPRQQHIARRNAAADAWAESDPQPSRHAFTGTRSIDVYMRAQREWLERLGEFGRDWDAANPAPPKTKAELADDAKLRRLNRAFGGG